MLKCLWKSHFWTGRWGALSWYFALKWFSKICCAKPWPDLLFIFLLDPIRNVSAWGEQTHPGFCWFFFSSAWMIPLLPFYDDERIIYHSCFLQASRYISVSGAIPRLYPVTQKMAFSSIFFISYMWIPGL